MADSVVVIIGGGGHARVVASTVDESGVGILGIYDDDPLKEGLNLGPARIIGPIANIDGSFRGKAIIAIGDNRTRLRMNMRFAMFSWATAIHPMTYVHRSVSIGEGTVIFAGAIIQPGAVIGKHCIINTKSTIDHDCVVGDYAHVGPGVCLAGNVTVGEGAFLGIGAVAVMGVSIGKWSNTGAGAAVIMDIPDNVTAAGVPARIINEL